MHQDVLSEKFCGEGIPSWAADVVIKIPQFEFPFPLEAPYTAVSSIDGFPTREDCAKHGWPSYYNTRATASAFGEHRIQFLFLLTQEMLNETLSSFFVNIPFFT